jgi:hypothetical protein
VENIDQLMRTAAAAEGIVDEKRTPFERPVNSGRHGFWAPLWEKSSVVRGVDILIFALILGFGALQFFQVERASDFAGDDVFFSDAARSLLDHGFYGINGYAETNMPPGTSAILAILCLAGGCSHLVFLRAMTVFGTLGFLASYQLLRCQAPRAVSAAICLLLISSRTHFFLVTELVGACYPYFFTAMTALLVARKLESATHLTSRVGWGALMTALVAASLMFASAATALLGAIVASICVNFFRDRTLAFARLRVYLPILFLGIAVQGIWMHQAGSGSSAGISASEWPVPGFPQSYLSQLKLKSGNNPELGMAAPLDIAERVLKNASEQANLLSQTLLRTSLAVTSVSILVIVPLFLITLGWCYSTWRTGDALRDWYFAGYQFTYLLWPWNPSTGWLFLPVMPLACLYLWHGGKLLVLLAKDRPRLLGVVWFQLAVLLTVWTSILVHRRGSGVHLENSGLQVESSFLIWPLSAILAAWMVWAGNAWLAPASALWRWIFQSIDRVNPLRLARILGMVVVVSLIVTGLAMQLEIGRANLDLNAPKNRLSADAEAASWIRSHTDPHVVVMARAVPTAYHYSERKMVWFPPTSNPHLLMEGIRKNNVDFVIVVRRKDSYYLPTDDDSFAPLLAAYQDNFRMVRQTPEFRIFQVVGNAVPQSIKELGVQ